METFREWLIRRTELNEMAIDRSKAEKVITSLSDEVYEHLLKILYWKDELNYNKHIKDIDTWLIKVDRIEIKPNSKKLKTQDYLNWLYEDMHSSERQLEKTINKLSKDYGNLPIVTDKTNLYQKIKNIYSELSKDLSSDKFSTISKYI